jgi:hypothetical protein
MVVTKIDIWVEGIADQKFLADVISSWFNIKFSKANSGKTFQGKNESYLINIRATGSVEAFKSLKPWNNIKQDFVDNQNQGIKNLIIADADGGFEKSKIEIANTISSRETGDTVNFNVETDLYLWPFNHGAEEQQDLEQLLVRIINPIHQTILNCFDEYENCLKSSVGGNYFTPNRKAKMYAYALSLTKSGNEQERDYTNPDHWDLNPENPYLAPLKSFLDTHFVPN